MTRARLNIDPDQLAIEEALTALESNGEGYLHSRKKVLAILERIGYFPPPQPGGEEGLLPEFPALISEIPDAEVTDGQGRHVVAFSYGIQMVELIKVAAVGYRKMAEAVFSTIRKYASGSVANKEDTARIHPRYMELDSLADHWSGAAKTLEAHCLGLDKKRGALSRDVELRVAEKEAIHREHAISQKRANRVFHHPNMGKK